MVVETLVLNVVDDRADECNSSEGQTQSRSKNHQLAPPVQRCLDQADNAVGVKSGGHPQNVGAERQIATLGASDSHPALPQLGKKFLAVLRSLRHHVCTPNAAVCVGIASRYADLSVRA